MASRSRLLTVWWDHWPIVAAGLVEQLAVVVRHNRVIACSPAAQAAGVTVGQRRRAAQQRCPGAELVAADPDGDARAFEQVVRIVGEFTPRLELVEPGWLCIESRGPSRYFGGDERLVEQLVAAVTASSGTAAGLGVGIADGRFAAAVAARLAARRTDGARRSLVVAPGASPAFLAPLGVRWLDEVGEVDAELAGLFARLGLTTLGALAAVPAADLAARFGPPGDHAHRLAVGGDERPSRPAAPATERAAERSFDDPVTQVEPLVFVAKQLADGLVAELDAAALACVRLAVSAETEHGERSERVWYRAAGLSPTAMVERVRWQLDGWIGRTGTAAGSGIASEAPSAGVILLRLDPVGLRPAGGDQLRLWGGLTELDDRALRAVSRLLGIAGTHAVTVPAWRGGRLPAERFEWIPAVDVDLADAAAATERVRPQVARRQAPWPGSLPAPRPALVLAGDRPRPVLVAAADGAVVTVSGRGELSAAPATLTFLPSSSPSPSPSPSLSSSAALQRSGSVTSSRSVVSGSGESIVAWAGPWPVDQRWWHAPGDQLAPRRHRRVARFQLATADGAAHLVALEQGQWWLLATYA